MKCPFCSADEDRVLDTRLVEEGAGIRRRRLCMACHRRFTTYERIEGITIKVVKKDGGREPFDRGKIKRGLERACYKRPVSDAQLDAVVYEVENTIEASFDAEVESRYIGELVMRHLRELDEVAFVRFASVYRQFQDVRDFVDELAPILREASPREESPCTPHIPVDD